MSIPQFGDKYNAKAILKPEDMLAYRQRAGMLPKRPGPEAVIICLQRGLPERVKRHHAYRPLGRLNGDLLSLKEGNGKLAVLTNFGLGSPQIAGLAEELIAWGAKHLISISMCGGLDPALARGAIVICDRAIRDEGTSHHYLPPEKYVQADKSLVERLQTALKAGDRQVITGTTWTTDATFRETDVEVAQYQTEGVKTVEMETAALFAVAQVRKIQAASIFVVGDHLSPSAWSPPSDMKEIDRSFEIAYSATIDALSQSLSTHALPST